MSVESAKAFVERIKTDPEFASKINEFKNWDEVQSYVKQTGFDFTKEELNSLNDELTENELDLVVGGARFDHQQ